MQHIFKRIVTLVALAVAGAIAAACGDTSRLPLPSGPLAGISGSGGPDSSTTPPTTTPPQTSNGPVASVQVSPHEMTLPKGFYRELIATAIDAHGVRVDHKPTWRSSDASVVDMQIAGDSGVAFGKALGTAKVYATVDGHTDSATVTVIDAPPQTPPPPVEPGVGQFNFTVVVSGSLGTGADTSKTELVPGAIVRLRRIGGVSGDTLAVPVDAGSAVTDANGVASFSALAGGSYSIGITPPADSPWAPATVGIGPPHVIDVRSGYTLFRKQ